MVQQYQLNNINSPIRTQVFNSTGLGNIQDLDLDSDLIIVLTDSAPVELRLPNANQIPGQSLCIKAANAGATGNTVVVRAQGGQAVDGVSRVSLTQDQESIIVKAAGGSAGAGYFWQIVGSSGPAQSQIDEIELDLRVDAPIVVAGDGPVSVNGITWIVAQFANSSIFEFTSAGCTIASPSGINRLYDGDVADPAPRLLLPIAAGGPLDLLISDLTRPIEVWADWDVDLLSLPNHANVVYCGVSGGNVGGFDGMAIGSGYQNYFGTLNPSAQSDGTFIRPPAAPAPLPNVTTMSIPVDAMGFGFWSNRIGQDWPERISESIGRSVWGASSGSDRIIRRSESGFPAIYFAVNTASAVAGPAVSATLRRIKILVGS